jgi:hypothetical protein
MGHDATVHSIWVPVNGSVTRYPVINDTLVPLFHIVLATIVRGRRHERELLAVFICRAIVGEVEFVSFGIIVLERVGIFVS